MSVARQLNWTPGSTPIPQGIVARAVAGFRNMFSGNQNQSAAPPAFAPPFDPTVNSVVNWRIALPPVDWFGPGQPLSPVAPPDTAGRAWDFPSYSNIDILQKPREGVDFPVLIALANSYDLLGLLIDTRKDQVCKLRWAIGYRNDSKQPDKRCEKITDFFALPDKEHSWQEWLRLLLDDMLVIDAATVFPRMTKGGELYALEPIDGSTINRIIDNYGRTPLAPDPAYQQRLKGLPAVNYTRDQLIYKPRNITTRRLFGISPVERVILTVQTALNRQLWQSQFYTDGSTPDLIMSVPAEWQTKQIAEFENWFNGMLSGNTAERRRAKFVPHGVDTINTKEGALTDPFDQWLARICCYCMGMSPQPFVAQMNRATAETADQQSKEEGIGPHMAWVKSLMDYIIAHPMCFNSPDLEFAFEESDETDPLKKAQIDDLYVKFGIKTIDEVRDDAGDDPLPGGLGAEPLIYTAQGAILLRDVLNPPEPTEPVKPSSGQSVQVGGVETQAKKPTSIKMAKARKPAVDSIVPEIHIDVDVPYGFGISEDGERVYRDSRIPSKIKVDGITVDVDITCMVHELTEFAHIQDGEDYDQAHDKATVAEESLVRGLGVSPSDYEAALKPYLDAAYQAAKAGGQENIPPDLARYPYIAEGEEKLIAAEKLAKRSKKKSPEPTHKQIAALKAAIYRALKNTVRSIVTQYTHKFSKASNTDHGDSFLHDVDLVEIGVLINPFVNLTTAAAEEAFTDVLVQVGADFDPVFGIANTRAKQIAADRAAELIGDDGGELAEATRLLIRGLIEQAFADGWSSSELANELESSYAFSEDRAAVIAETELRMAIGAGAIEGARSSGVVVGKQWLLSNDEGICDECQDNADEGVIDLDEDFSTGDDTVPAHPNCRCVVIFLTDNNEGEE